MDITHFTPDASLPDYRIPTSLAVVLDTVLHKAAPRVDALPAAVLTDILERGVISWIAEQPAHLRSELGLSPKPSLAVAAIVDEDDYGDADDPDPASAQRAADAYMNGTLGYSSMTLHAGFGQNRGGQGQPGLRKKSRGRGAPSGGGGGGNGQQQQRPASESNRHHSRNRRRKNHPPRSH
jgi:hypothetical protein